MIKIENTEVYGWEAAIRGMRNPKNSWNKSDSVSERPFVVGKQDMHLMQTLAGAGSDHGKFLRMITVTCDITAPLYWWKEFDTYKVGTVANSCSTMHKIAAKKFEPEDFSCENLMPGSMDTMIIVIKTLNDWRNIYINYDEWGNDGFPKPTKKEVWWQLIQLLPSSYNQRRTVMLNYEVLRRMYNARKEHKLNEWRETFCDWVRGLPYAKELIIGED